MIIAIDFDGTLCKNAYPYIGEVATKHRKTIDQAKRARELGHILVLNTCREGDHLRFALAWCKLLQGLEFDYVNESPEEAVEMYGDSRKVGADLYVDDKAPGSIEYFLAYEFHRVHTKPFYLEEEDA